MLAGASVLNESSRKNNAVLAVNMAAANGDPNALFTLAHWRWQGDVMPQDIGQARELYRKASEQGHETAGIFYTNLIANGIGGSADWKAAMKRLRDEASRHPHRKRALSLIRKMSLDPKGDPTSVPTGRTLSDTPQVTLFRRLFSKSECEYLAHVADPDFKPSFVVDLQTGREERDPVRTSDGAVIHWLIEDPVVHALNRRLAAISDTAFEQGEPLQILRYRPGQQYLRHRDAIPGYENQRIKTVLVYLNEGYEGGETCFLHTELRVKGRMGDAIVFRNTLDSGVADPASEHAGLPITVGTKLLASRWIRQRAHTPGSAKV
jgi:prolyl 4-hydroxylase